MQGLIYTLWKIPKWTQPFRQTLGNALFRRWHSIFAAHRRALAQQWWCLGTFWDARLGRMKIHVPASLYCQGFEPCPSDWNGWMNGANLCQNTICSALSWFNTGCSVWHSFLFLLVRLASTPWATSCRLKPILLGKPPILALCSCISLPACGFKQSSRWWNLWKCYRWGFIAWLGGWVIVSFVCSGIHLFACLPVVTVVPHKAVAEVSRIGNL